MINHVAVIPDGNRRWARERGLSYLEAYRRGVEKIREIVRYISEHDLARYITFYVLSTENILRRSREELTMLFYLLKQELRRVREDEDTYRYGIRVKVIGMRELLSQDIVQEIELTEKATSVNSKCTVILAIAYGGVYEPFHVLHTRLREQSYNELLEVLVRGDLDMIYRRFTYLGSENIPPPDVIIRTGGEVRLSNFLLPHAPGARLVFLNKYWPDVTVNDIEQAIKLVERKNQYLAST